MEFTITVERHYNEDCGTMKITLLHVYQVFSYIRVEKQIKQYIKSWD